MTLDTYEAKKIFLDNLFYKEFKQPPRFEVCKLWVDEQGNSHCTKWQEYISADKKIIKEANNRLIPDVEIVLDIDGKSPQKISDKYNSVITKLDTLKLKYRAYFSGSRGYHIHLIFYELRLMTEAKRRRFKQDVIRWFDCDMQKASERNMIPIENVMHWKTNNPKKLVRLSK